MSDSPKTAPNQPLLVLSSFPNEAVANAIAKKLVEEGLTACVSIIPGAHSIYIWKGSVQEDQECLGLLKTQASRYPQLEERLTALHPYETPEVLAIDIDHGAPTYLKWLADSLSA